MTSVRLGLVGPTHDGSLELLRGSVALSPYRRTFTPTEPSDAVLPVPFVVKLDGVTAPTVELNHEWIWVGKEVVPRGITRTVMVPAPVVGVVPDWADLVDVDPKSLAPTAEPESAWWLALETALGNLTENGYVAIPGPPGPIPSDVVRTVDQGTDPNTPRPEGSNVVYWIGSATPLNAIPADLWFGG